MSDATPEVTPKVGGEPPRSGYLSSEFATTLIAMAAMVLVSSGKLSSADSSAFQAVANNFVAAAIALVSWCFTHYRTSLKKEAMK